MERLVELLKRAQFLASTISNGEKITPDILEMATDTSNELDELIGWFDPNWTMYEEDYVYDEELIRIAKQFMRGKI
jgi:hypothetical protein